MTSQEDAHAMPVDTPESAAIAAEPSAASDAEPSDAEKAALEAAFTPDDPYATPAGSGHSVGRPSPSAPSGTSGVLFQFIIFPFAIVLVCLSVYGFFTWAFAERRSYQEYLHAIATGWEAERWQSCYELHFRLLDRDDPLKSQANIPATIALFEQAKQFQDKRVRAQLAVVLDHLGDPNAEGVLTEALADPNPNTRLNSLFALRKLGGRDALPAIYGLLDGLDAEDPDKLQRPFLKVAGYTLGELGARLEEAGEPAPLELRERLVKLLQHGADDVRWNAALGLARLRDRRALPVLSVMIDRQYLDPISGMKPRQREVTMINALRGLGLVGADDLKERITKVSKTDKSLKVRHAALRLLAELKANATKKG